MYWQQQVNYTIEVSLNDKEKSLNAFEKITYTNNSPDTLTFIWFHLWPNAYKNDKTAFAEQTLQNGSTKFYFSSEESKGYINQLDFKVNGGNATIEEHPQHIDIIKLVLPKPLAPKQSINITTPFFVQLPNNFSRGGYVGETFQITQWYPKPAVYDAKGWHEMPYLDQGEFYSDFGNFKVQITLPENFIVAASGELQNKEELEKLKLISKTKATEQPNFKLYLEKLKGKKKTDKYNADSIKNLSSTKTKTLEYSLQNAHDFAWFASKLFLVQYDTLQLATKNIDVFSFYNPWQAPAWKESITYAKDGLKKYSKWVGDYPYNTATIVAGSDNVNSGGMEYPSITLITTSDIGQGLDATIVHEIGHNWFYGALASNERKHPWMDEGMNTYYQKRYELEKYGNPNLLRTNSNSFINKRVPTNMELLLEQSINGINKGQPIDTLADAYTQMNYFLSVYSKGSRWMQMLEKDLGTELFDKCMKQYYTKWQFKHPYPEDFKISIQKSSNRNIDVRFQQLYNTKSLTSTNDNKKTKLVSFFSLKETDKYNYLSIAPVVGYNNYDKPMLGAVLHNYQLPLPRFQFFVAPLFATGSKQFNYSGRVSYNTYKKNSWLEVSASALKFTMDDFKPQNADKIYQAVTRFVPSIKYTVYNKDLRKTQRWIFQARSFLLNENGLEFKTVVTPTGSIDMVNKTSINSTINQIKITTTDNRVLYPYQLNLNIDQGKNFVRAGLTGDYFFNYGDKKGGIDARLFAGKFFYTSSKTFIKQFETDRYHLNMSGAKGYEDYTYSNYFVGRNEFEGAQSQQIMQRDGFFKVSTDLLSNKIGKTDDWLLAMNFSGTIPDKINILNVLPIKIPLKFFVDIGTYAEAWKDNPATGRFLYDAGLQISLLNSLVNIYVPILYSKVYGDYFKSTLGQKRFMKTISFSIDIQKLQINKLNRDIPL